MNELIETIRFLSFENANSVIKKSSGIVEFFSSEEEKDYFLSKHESYNDYASEEQVAYGDWQTPKSLAFRVCQYHLSRFGAPEVVIEPTCGLGAFVMASLDLFPNLKVLYAIEINKEYVSELKLRILIKGLQEPKDNYPEIYIYNADFFKFDFSAVIEKIRKSKMRLGVIGNPPWVTNSIQGKNAYTNLPVKYNGFGLKGIEAITGKSNFDISESITLLLLKLTQNLRGGMTFLLKNSVIRNIIAKQPQLTLSIGNFEQANIDAFSEFEVSVNAACLSAEFSCKPMATCIIKDLYTKRYIREFGWINNAFVSDTQKYSRHSEFDGKSSYEWRSGIKHDCASVLELKKINGKYINGLDEVVDIEEEMIYPLLKSSDISNYTQGCFRKYIIITQHKVGEDTSRLALTYPKTYEYLESHQSFFLKRKSSIYKNKDIYSIFGIGEYSFKPFKIAVSSLYKNIVFKLIQPEEGRAVMLDDTCYQLDFDTFQEAETIFEALQSDAIQSLLMSLIFQDAKRVVTKSLLMRLDLSKYCLYKGININTTRIKTVGSGELPLFD